MNRIFQTLWNELSQSFVAVGENATRKGKRSGASASAEPVGHGAGRARRSSVHILALEPRIMFDGAALATVASSSPVVDDPNHTSAPTTGGSAMSG